MNELKLRMGSDECIAFIGDIHADSMTPSSRIDNYMETCKNKLVDVSKKCAERNVKHLFIAGDVFSRISTTHEAVNEIGTAFKTFESCGIKLYSIIGNHDMIRNSTDNFQKSPLQTMFTFDIINHISQKTPVIINDRVVIHPVDYTEYPETVKGDGKYHILLAHMFFNASRLIADERHNLESTGFGKMGYDAAFLGHDHEEYGDSYAGKCVVFRTGSMTRGTAHNYNFQRKPKFLVLRDLDNLEKGIKERCEKVIIEHKPFEDVISASVNSKKALDGEYDLKEVLANLASKLSEGAANDNDRILEIIKSDESLSVECRMILMRYISEE